MTISVRTALQAAAIAGAIVLIAACGEEAPPAGAGGPPGGQMPPPQVSVVPVAERTVPITTVLPGRTAAYLTADVRPQVSGLVLRRVVEEGTDVAEGDLLYEIDPRDYEIALASARAALQRAEAGFSTLSTQSKRVTGLAAKGIVAKQAKDDASGSVRAARADIAGARAAMNAAKLALERTEVRAPIAGRVGRGTAMPGALVTAYQTNLATVRQLDPIYVDITRSSVEVLQLRKKIRNGTIGRPEGEDGAETAAVTLSLEDGTAYPHAGRLQFSDAVVDENTGAITLRAVFPNPEGLLLPGMYVQARVQEGVVANAMLVPQQGVTRDPKGNAIALVINKEGMVEARVLTVDRTVGDQWLVTAGVSAGEPVIVEGLQKVRPGAPATGVPFGAPAPGATGPGGP